MNSLARKVALGLALFAGALLGAQSTGYSQQNARQCYYRIGIDSPTACTACADTCLGTGYRCCEITVVQT